MTEGGAHAQHTFFFLHAPRYAHGIAQRAMDMYCTTLRETYHRCTSWSHEQLASVSSYSPHASPTTNSVCS